jgi:hypothetical protein
MLYVHQCSIRYWKRSIRCEQSSALSRCLPQWQFAVGKTGAQRRCHRNILRRTQDFAVCIEQNRVAAFQRGQAG